MTISLKIENYFSFLFISKHSPRHITTLFIYQYFKHNINFAKVFKIQNHIRNFVTSGEQTMTSTFQITELPYDLILEKAKEQTKKSNKPFGEITVGPKNVMLPKPYAAWAEKILDMEVRKDDTWIISIPRSGTTWTEEMTWLISNNLDYTAAQNNILHKRFMYLELACMMGDKKLEKEFWTPEKVMAAESPRFIKTHLSLELLPKQLWTVKPKIIYVYRNPKDVVISQYHFVRMINDYQGTFEEWAEIFLQDKCIYNPFWPHVLDFWKLQKKDDILFLSYEIMKQDLKSVVHKVAKYLGKHLSEDEANKLTEHLDYENMKKNKSVNQEKQLTDFKIVSRPEEANFIRKGISGEWKQKMSSEMVANFDYWSYQYINDTDFPYYK